MFRGQQLSIDRTDLDHIKKDRTSQVEPLWDDIVHDFKRKNLDVLKAPLGHGASYVIIQYENCFQFNLHCSSRDITDKTAQNFSGHLVAPDH